MTTKGQVVLLRYVAYVFLATGVTLYETLHEPAEVIELRPVPRAEALRMVHANEIGDEPSALAILLGEPLLQDLSTFNDRLAEGPS